MATTETDVLRLLLARRENYGVTSVSHQKGRVYSVLMNGEQCKAVVLVSSFQYYELRYHIADELPTLAICYEHTSVLPIPVLSMRAGNYAKPYELPETITDVEAQRCTKVGSQVLLGQYLCGIKAAQSLINKGLPDTTRKRYLSRARALAKHKRGKPVGRKDKAS